VAEDILISLEARHVKNILKGTKTVELRRRRLDLADGARVWMYSKVPRGCVEALGIVEKAVEQHPRRIWREYGKLSGLTLQEFNRYLGDLSVGHVIVFREIRHLKPTLGLEALRKRLGRFQPPQFFKRLAADSRELTIFRSALN